MVGAKFEFEGIGTHWVIDIEDEVVDKQTLLNTIQERVAIYDRDYSRFRGDSLVAKMSREAGEYVLPTDAKPMFDLYEQFYRITGGAVTPLIGSVMEEAGYDAAYSLTPKTLHAPLGWDEAMVYSYPKLTIKRPALIDVGAAGKGYLIDIVADILKANGYANFCVDAGGDIFYANTNNKTLRTGLENPLDTSQAIGVANIINQSICGSAGNRRAWDKYHHIINPRTLESPREILATWVVAETTLLADMLTTCLFFVPPGALKHAAAFEYALMYADGSAEKSSQFPGEFFA